MFSFFAVFSGVQAAAAAAGAVDVVHLYPEQSRDFQKHICGDVQLFHVHELDPHKVYDLKISYPASLPTTFTVDVQRVLLAPTRTAAGGTVVRKVPRRMLNTEKLRLVPLELLREHVHVPLSGVVGATQQHREERFRFDDLPGARDGDVDHHATKDNAATADDADDQEDRHSIQQGEFIIEISVRGDVEGVSPVLDLAQRVCVYNIVVEEMLLAAFPRDTLVLIAWLLVLLALALRVALPFVTSLVALERVQDREISSELSPEPQHTKTS